MSLSLADNSCLTAKAARFITGKLLELACSLVPTPLSTALSFFRRYCNLVQSWSHLFCVIREHFCSMSVQMEYLVNSQQVFRFLQCQKRDQSLHSEKSRASWGRKPLHNGRINDLGPSGLPTVVVRHHEKSERVVSRGLLCLFSMNWFLRLKTGRYSDSTHYLPLTPNVALLPLPTRSCQPRVRKLASRLHSQCVFIVYNPEVTPVNY